MASSSFQTVQTAIGVLEVSVEIEYSDEEQLLIAVLNSPHHRRLQRPRTLATSGGEDGDRDRSILRRSRKASESKTQSWTALSGRSWVTSTRNIDQPAIVIAERHDRDARKDRRASA